MRLVVQAWTAWLILVISLSANAAERTIWECRTGNPSAKPILYLVRWGDRSYIKFSYLRIAAQYEQGEDHQAWYWHNDGSGYYRYGLVLGSDDKAWYHDFRSADAAEESVPLDYFVCRQDEDD
jgi:hypothetical protein